jgi:hypothetical protein
MEGTTRLAEFLAGHPEVECPPPVDGVLHAWIPDGSGGGAAAHGRDEDELLAKLAETPPA